MDLRGATAFLIRLIQRVLLEASDSSELPESTCVNDCSGMALTSYGVGPAVLQCHVFGPSYLFKWFSLS